MEALHRRTGKPLGDDALEVGVGGQATARRAATLEGRERQVAGTEAQPLRPRSVSASGIAVTIQTMLFVGFATARALGLGGIGRRSRGAEMDRRPGEKGTEQYG